MLEVTKNAPQMTVIHVGQAFKNFFAGTAEYPTFKKKGRHDSFTLTNDQCAIKGRQVHIPTLGWVRMDETVRFVGKVVEGTVSRTADRWCLSVTVEIPDPPVVRKPSGGRLPPPSAPPQVNFEGFANGVHLTASVLAKMNA